MEWLDAFRSHAVALPNLAKFAIVMAIIAGVPALTRRVRLPELVGLLACGILLGPYVLAVAPMNHPIVQFFGVHRHPCPICTWPMWVYNIFSCRCGYRTAVVFVPAV